jgi:hypothetical protein
MLLITSAPSYTRWKVRSDFLSSVPPRAGLYRRSSGKCTFSAVWSLLLSQPSRPAGLGAAGALKAAWKASVSSR